MRFPFGYIKHIQMHTYVYVFLWFLVVNVSCKSKGEMMLRACNKDWCRFVTLTSMLKKMGANMVVITLRTENEAFAQAHRRTEEEKIA